MSVRLTDDAAERFFCGERTAANLKGPAMIEELFIPEDDVIERGADGLDRLVAPKGVPIPLAEAKARGLVKEPKPSRPKETKRPAESASDAESTKKDAP